MQLMYSAKFGEQDVIGNKSRQSMTIGQKLVNYIVCFEYLGFMFKEIVVLMNTWNIRSNVNE